MRALGFAPSYATSDHVHSASSPSCPALLNNLPPCALSPTRHTSKTRARLERQEQDKEAAAYLSPPLACVSQHVTRSTIHHALSGSTSRGEARSATMRMSAKVTEKRKHPKDGYAVKQARHGYEAQQARLSASQRRSKQHYLQRSKQDHLQVTPQD